MTATPSTMIEVDDLCKAYGQVRAVDHINFGVGRGEIVGFLGPNGAGKSTTIRILTTYLPATSGVARVAGHDVMGESMQVRKQVGYLPQRVPLYLEMKVDEYLQYRAKLKGVERRERPKRLDYVLERCRIRPMRNRLIDHLSEGYKQRVGLADALIHDPPILILDEPTAGSDPIQIREVLTTVKELGSDHTILLSTHILSEVEAVCGRVIIINRGRIGLDSKLADLSTDTTVILLEVRGPADQVTRAIESTEGVASVTARPAGEGVTAFEVRTQADRDVREALAKKVAQAGWVIRRLDLRQRRLEDHFVDVVLRTEAEPEPAVAAAV